MNTGNPRAAKQHHLEALAIFDSLNDQQGDAATSDLLGMTRAILGEFAESRQHYLHAVDLFDRLNDQQGLASSLSMLAWMSVMTYSDQRDPAAISAEALAYSERAVQVARAAGWRAGEAYALFSSGVAYVATGQAGQAMAFMESGLALAEAIGHRQWTLATNYGLGHLYYGLLDLPTTRQYYEKALGMAHEIGSLHWQHQISGPLALVCVDMGDIDRAGEVLDAVGGGQIAPDDINRRNLYHASAELALARGDADTALQRANLLLEAPESLLALGPNNIIRITQLKSRALLRLNREAEAARVLESLLRQTEVGRWKDFTWGLRADLAKLYRAAGRLDEARLQLERTRQSIDVWVEMIPEGQMRNDYHRRALAALEG